MPAPFGVTASGFSRPTVQELIALVDADLRADLSASLDLSTDSIIGQLVGIFCQQLGIAWEATEDTYHGFDPDRAEDDALVSLAKITGTNKRGASKSTVPVRVTLAAGVTLEAGTHFAHVEGKEDVRFTVVEDFTAPGPADPDDYFLTFESENAGPVQAPSGTLTVIATPVVGWSGVTNTEDATAGRLSDSNQELRVRREQALARAGSSTAQAIRADVLAVTNVTSVQVFENYTDTTDVDGLPPHSFEVVLWDDAGANDDAVAQAIWDTKAAGIRPFGQTGDQGTATDANGDPHTVPFSRAAQVSMYIEFDLTPRAGYVGDADFKLAVAQALNAEFGTGDDVGFYDILDAAHGLGAKVLAVRFGTAASPTDDVDTVITTRQIARFDTGRIAINP
jgi:uncharacterized phage protein gp47/JayE